MEGKRERERAEIERSSIEAKLTADAKLPVQEAVVARYLSSARTSAYPLEYSYSLLGDVTGKTVLDFGCGSGANSVLLARRGARVIAFDISESLINLAARRLTLSGLERSARFVVGSAHDLPLADASIDVVFGIAILHHLDLESASREIARVLKPGGRAVFQEPVRDSRLVKALRRCVPYRRTDVSPFERPLTTPELDRFGSRFSRKAVRAFSLPFVNLALVLPPLGRRSLDVVFRADAALLRHVPALLPFAGIHVLELTK